MKGTRIVIEGPRSISQENFEVDPDQIGPGEVLVQLSYSLISAGTELAIYTGRDPRVYEPGEWCAYPFRPGVIGVGRVLRIGERIKHVRAGEMVFCYPHHASLDYVDAEKFLCLPVPSDLPLQTVLLARPSTIALTALRLSRPELGDRVVVFGLGLIGNLAAQLFSLAGGRVLGIDLVAQRRELAEKSGKVRTLAPEHLSPQVVESILAGRPNIIVDAVGNSAVVASAVKMLEPKGQLILLGTPHDEYQTDLTRFLREIHFHWVTVRGALEWCFPPYDTGLTKHSYESNTRLVLQFLQSGAIQTAGLISHIITPGEFQSVYEDLLRHQDQYFGVAVKWGD